MIAALVCGQSDGKFFAGRNTFPLIGRPMMIYPLLAAQHTRSVERVFLSTDAPAMENLGRHQSVTVLERSPEMRAEDAELGTIVAGGYRQITEAVGQDLEALVVLLCNAPTVTADMIDKGINVLRSDSTWNAVASVSLHNEFNPRYALRLEEGNRLQPFAASVPHEAEVFFPDALVWVLRPSAYFDGRRLPSGWLMNFADWKVAPLIHEGYGDVDFPWQVPAVEEWLRRRGFSSESTPYENRFGTMPKPLSAPAQSVPTTAVERRILITTVPFGDPHRRPLALLEADGIEYTINPRGRRLAENELAELAREFGVLIAGTEPITARVMDAAPHLRLISRVGIGLDNVDLLAARERNILVTYTPDAPSPAVAELTLALMLSLLRQIPTVDRGMRNGVWRRFLGRRLDGLTVGVVGVGRVGKRVIRHIRGGFPGVSILANDLDPDLEFGHQQAVRWVEKDTLYAEADIISLHLPLTPLTRRLITTREMESMKPSALLVNTARGSIIDEQDLAEALRAGRLAGAAIDVFEQEPYTGVLATLDRCLLTCHMGSMSEDSRSRMELEATEETLRFLRGEPLRQAVPEEEYALRTAPPKVQLDQKFSSRG